MEFFFIKKCQKSRDTVPLSLQLQQALSFHVHIPIFYPDINGRGEPAPYTLDFCHNGL